MSGATQSTPKTLPVSEAEAGMRLDRFLAARLPELGRAGARALLTRGLVRVDSRRGRAGQRLEASQVVTLAAEAVLDAHARPDPEVLLRIVHEDELCVVVDKPGGQPSHPLRPGELGTLASGLCARYPEMRGIGYSSREPGLVHRLDGGTSGLVLAARSAQAFAFLRRELEAGEIDKRYVALCVGQVTAPRRVEAWLLARGARVEVRAERFEGARPIATELLSATPYGAFSLLELRAPRAARHQLRAHLAALGHPIAGDALYGGRALDGLQRHFLHASALSFCHPRDQARLAFEAPLPPDLRSVLERHGY